jgi:hypothetical protein
MSEHPFQAWLDKAANYSGVLACGVCLSPQSIAVKSFAEVYPEPRLKEVVQCLAEVVFNLRYYQLGGSRLRWVFEHGELHATQRPDKAIAVLATNKDPNTAAAIEELFAEFLATVRPSSRNLTP